MLFIVEFHIESFLYLSVVVLSRASFPLSPLSLSPKKKDHSSCERAKGSDQRYSQGFFFFFDLIFLVIKSKGGGEEGEGVEKCVCLKKIE